MRWWASCSQLLDIIGMRENTLDCVCSHWKSVVNRQESRIQVKESTFLALLAFSSWWELGASAPLRTRSADWCSVSPRHMALEEKLLRRFQAELVQAIFPCGNTSVFVLSRVGLTVSVLKPGQRNSLVWLSNNHVCRQPSHKPGLVRL